MHQSTEVNSTMTTENKKKRKPRVLYIAIRDGHECGVLMAKDLGLGPALCKKRGLLVPSEKPVLFTSFAEMNRMMTRTQKAWVILKGSTVDQHPRLRPLLSTSSAFTFKKVIRRKGELIEIHENSSDK